jgi:hypothetical protein
LLVSPLHRAASGLALTLVLASLGAACRDRSEPVRVVAREEHLRRQIEDLRSLVQRAEKGALVPSDGAVIAISEALAQRLLQLALPREVVFHDRFRARLEKAEVRFRDKHGAVRFDGRVSWAGDADLYDAEVSADMAVFARFETVEVHPRQGTLIAQIVPMGIKIHSVNVGGESRAARRLAEAAAEQTAESLSALAFPLTIPVAVEHELRFAGVEEGPVRLRGGSIPLRAVVRDASAHGGRLWIVLQVEAGS